MPGWGWHGDWLQYTVRGVAIIVVLFEVHPRVCSDCSSAVVRGAPFWW